MGCDIHPWVQWQQSHDGGQKSTHGFRAPLDRNYVLFGLMTGGAVRFGGDEAVGLHLGPKGLPKHLCHEAAAAFLVPVYERMVEDGERDWYVDIATAESWVANGSRWAHLHKDRDLLTWSSVTPAATERTFWQGTNPYYGRVDGPDWHTPSWLDVRELRRVQRAYAAMEEPASVAVMPEGFPLAGATELLSWDDAEAPCIKTPEWDAMDCSQLFLTAGTLGRARDFAERRIEEDGFTRLSRFRFDAQPWGPNPRLAMTIAAMEAAEEAGMENVHLWFFFDN